MSDDPERLRRHGEGLFKMARGLGWQDDGEGALEYVTRLAYEQGIKDQIAHARGER